MAVKKRTKYRVERIKANGNVLYLKTPQRGMSYRFWGVHKREAHHFANRVTAEKYIEDPETDSVVIVR